MLLIDERAAAIFVDTLGTVHGVLCVSYTLSCRRTLSTRLQMTSIGVRKQLGRFQAPPPGMRRCVAAIRRWSRRRTRRMLAQGRVALAGVAFSLSGRARVRRQGDARSRLGDLRLMGDELERVRDEDVRGAACQKDSGSSTVGKRSAYLAVVSGAPPHMMPFAAPMLSTIAGVPWALPTPAAAVPGIVTAQGFRPWPERANRVFSAPSRTILEYHLIVPAISRWTR